MTERPILFSAPMVRAILAGTKTQTRRAVKHEAPDDADGCCWLEIDGVHNFCWVTGEEQDIHPSAKQFRCPYGQPGDRLWVRETFAKIDGQTQPWIETDYRATYTHGHRLGDTLGIKKRWTPAIHMPRAASRITLEVTGVRVERLQDISHVDALAEGITTVRSADWDRQHFPDWKREFDAACVAGRKPPIGPSPVESFAALWRSINGPGSWAANPFVWVVEFKRLEQAA